MTLQQCVEVLELDELYWFVERKSQTETRENVYVMTAVSRDLPMRWGQGK